MQLGRAFPLSFPSTFLHSGCSTSNEFFFSSQRVVKEEGEAQRTNIEFEDTRVRKTERERKQDRLLGIDIEVSKGTRSYSLAWKASRSGRSPLRRIRAEDGGKLKALFKISRLSGPVWGGGEVKREEEEAHREAGERVERRSRDDEGILDEREPVVVTVLCESGRAQTDRGVSRRSAYVELVAPRWGVSCHRASVSCSRSGDDHRLLRD